MPSVLILRLHDLPVHSSASLSEIHVPCRFPDPRYVFCLTFTFLLVSVSANTQELPVDAALYCSASTSVTDSLPSSSTTSGRSPIRGHHYVLSPNTPRMSLTHSPTADPTETGCVEVKACVVEATERCDMMAIVEEGEDHQWFDLTQHTGVLPSEPGPVGKRTEWQPADMEADARHEFERPCKPVCCSAVHCMLMLS